MFKKYLIVVSIALNLTGIAIKASDYAWQKEKKKLIQELADADAAWHLKDSPITYAIFSEYIKNYEKELSRYTSICDHIKKRPFPCICQFNGTVRVEKQTDIKAEKRSFSVLTTTVWSGKDTLETPSKTAIETNTNSLDSKITRAIEAKRKQLWFFQKQPDTVWLDDYTKCKSPVYYDGNRGPIKCTTSVPRNIRKQILLKTHALSRI